MHEHVTFLQNLIWDSWNFYILQSYIESSKVGHVHIKSKPLIVQTILYLQYYIYWFQNYIKIVQ